MEESQQQEQQEDKTLKEIVTQKYHPGSINNFVNKYLDSEFDATFYSEFEELGKCEKWTLSSMIFEFSIEYEFYMCIDSESFGRFDRIQLLSRKIRDIADEVEAGPPVFK